ncbi:hypothetical protein EMPS_11138 [Entomortierella parvispora]|uniref:AMP-dependent synthetase/ligase domain-containing protein n=1 Tax=Entomortierella parvispora TaxID=205924 RepID=A0A9P3HL77_9FUNG|nr:hypothetical protein EMPS_11138 [Entomortierella parvispora]
MLQSPPASIYSKALSPPNNQGGEHAPSPNLQHHQPAGAETVVKNTNLIDILGFRAGRQHSYTATPSAATATAPTSKQLAFTVVDSRGNEIGSWTWESVYDNAEKITWMLRTKSQLQQGDRVALIYRKAELLEFLAAFFGCLMAGMVAVPINEISKVSDVTFILANSGATLALTTEHNYCFLTKNFATALHQLRRDATRTKVEQWTRGEIGSPSQREHPPADWPSGVAWWKTDNLVRWKPKQDANNNPHSDKTKDATVSAGADLPDLAYIEYIKAPSGQLEGVTMSHTVVLEQCQFIGRTLTASSREAFPSHRRDSSPFRRAVVLSWLEPRQQAGLIMGAWMGLFHDHHTVFLHAGATARRGLWTRCIARYGATLAIGDYEGIRNLIQGASQLPASPMDSSSSSDDNSRRPSTGSSDSSKSPRDSNIRNDDCQSGNVKDIDHDSSSDQQRRGHNNRAERRTELTLRRFLVDTTTVQPQLHRQFEQEVLSDLLLSPSNSTLDCVVSPMATLPEYGGIVLSIREPSLLDGSSMAPPLEKQQSRCSQVHHFLLDRAALKSNVIRVIAVAKEAIARAQERGAILVESSGPMPTQATIAVVDPETTAVCEIDEVGEIWISATSHASEFWTLHSLPKVTCQAQLPAERAIATELRGVAAAKDFLRTGLLGCLIEGQLVVFGPLTERIRQEVQHPIIQRKTGLIEYDYYYKTDIVNTILERIVGFAACVVLELAINGQHLPIICAETPFHFPQKKDDRSKDVVRLSEYVLQALHDYYGLRPYCIALAAPGSLPRARKDSKQVHTVLCRQLLEEGGLPLIHLYTAADKTLLHCAVGDDPLGGIWGNDALAARQAAVTSHTLRVQWSKCESSKEIFDRRRHVDLAHFTNLAEMLVWRSLVTPEDVAYLVSSHAESSLVSTLGQAAAKSLPAESKSLSKILSKKSRSLQKKNSKGRSKSHKGDNSSDDSSSTSNQRSIQQPSPQGFSNFVPVTFRQLGILVVRIATFLEKNCVFQAGDKVVLLFPNGIEFVATVYACWFLGLIPVPVQLSGDAVNSERVHREDVAHLIGLLTELRVSHRPLLGSSATENFFKLRSTLAHIKACIGARQDAVVPVVLSVSKAPIVGSDKALGKESGFIDLPRAVPSSATSQGVAHSQDAVVFAHYSTDRRRTLVKATHGTLLAQSKAQKVQLRLDNIDPLVACWKSFSGLGFLQSCTMSVYTGAPTTLIDYEEFLKAPRVYFETLERHGVRDAVLDYTMLERVLLPSSGSWSSNTSSVENFTVITVKSERSQVKVHQMLERHFFSAAPTSAWPTSGNVGHTRYHRRPVNGMFSHMINPMVSTRAYMCIDPVRLYLSLEALRQGKIVVLENDAEESTEVAGIWVEDSGIPVCGTTIAIVNPESRVLCLSQEIGEIWVSSEANVQPYIGESPFVSTINDVYGQYSTGTSRYQAKLATKTSDIVGSSQSCDDITYARTGEVGFLWNYSRPDFNQGQATSLLFVLGPIGETFEVNGLLHFPQDVEETIEKSHPSIAQNGCIVFQAEQAIVCIVQTHEVAIGNDGVPHATVNLNMVLSVIHRIVESHQFVPDVIAVVAEGVLAKDRDGAKQRGRMLSLFMSAKMPLLYIHYPKGSLDVTESEAQSYQTSSIAFSLPRVSSSSLPILLTSAASKKESTGPMGAKDRMLAHRKSLPLSISISPPSESSVVKRSRAEISGLLTPASPLNDCGSTVLSKVKFYEAATAAAVTRTSAPLTPDSPVSIVSHSV